MEKLSIIELIELKREFEKDKLELENIKQNRLGEEGENYKKLLKTIEGYKTKIQKIKTILYNINIK